MIELKTKLELGILRECGRIVSGILAEVKKGVRPGITTKDLEVIADRNFDICKVVSAFKGYRGFPGSICVSVNEELVHGIPRKTKTIKDGDIVKVDIGIKHKGFFGDIAETVPVGHITQEVKDLLRVSYGSFDAVLKYANTNYMLGDISSGVQEYIESQGYSVIRDFVGHGIGRMLHEKPEVPNFGKHNTGPKLEPGIVMAVEPMVALGSWEIQILKDNWTVVMTDKKYCAHYEHMIAITENGPELLTHLDPILT
ncbi:MAG: type I methionyl aminopeptidase [Elusimicrobia bacterium RIFOXYA2_FULL_40_6]|nr:MAG: type I methionyl aminopeptidase [Elusimicrobia bacterium RIFOXYA2_FULL_40_6]